MMLRNVEKDGFKRRYSLFCLYWRWSVLIFLKNQQA